MHGFRPYQVKSDPWSSHSILIKWCASLNHLSRTVEVGIADGIIGELLLGNRNYELIGIEINKEWAHDASPFYDKIIISDINDVPDKVFLETDCVILADVLEHLPNPWLTLTRLVSATTPDCFFLISMPNVANIWVRLQLLFGNFNYVDRGLLDKTHLRFFTRKTFNKILNDNGFAIKEIAFTPIPIGLLHSFFLYNFFGRFIFKILAVITNFFPNLLAYQFLALCQKAN